MGELDEAMCEAIALGERAGKQGDVPVGAVVLDERGTVIGRRDSRTIRRSGLGAVCLDVTRKR